MIESLVDDMAKRRSDGTDVPAKAISVLAQAVGALVLSRACPYTARWPTNSWTAPGAIAGMRLNIGEGPAGPYVGDPAKRFDYLLADSAG